MITFTLNLNPNSTYPILAQEGLSSPGTVPVLTVGDKCGLSLKFWEGSQGTSTLTNKRLEDFSYIKFGSKVSKSSSTLVIYVDDFTEVLDSDGNYAYRSQLDLNTTELLAALDGKDSVELFTDVEVTFANGQRQTSQFKSTVRNQVVDNENPPTAIAQPEQVFFFGAYQAWLDDGNSGSKQDFMDTFDSVVPGPVGNMLGSSGVVEVTSDRMLTEDDDGKILFTNAGGSWTVTVDDSLPVGFSCAVAQTGSYPLIVSGAYNRFSFDRTGGTGAMGQIIKIRSGYWALTGDLT